MKEDGGIGVTIFFLLFFFTNRFLLYQRMACPLTLQPFSQFCKVGEPKKIFEGLLMEFTVADLLPYTAYEFQVQAENSVGGVDTPIWVRAETNSSG